MRNLFRKVDQSLSSVYGAITLLIVFVCYLLIGNIVEYYYGARVASITVFNNIFFALLLGLVVLSLFLSLLKRLPFKRRFIGFYLIHIGLITLIIATMLSSFTSLRASMTLAPKTISNKANLDKYQISLRERATGVTQYVDLNYSLRPQGLNLDFGAIYLISYLPYSEHYKTKVDINEQVSAVLTRESKLSKKLRLDKISLSTNNLDYPSFYLEDGLEFLLLNKQMNNCIKSLTKTNLSCVQILRRKSLDKIKDELCLENKYLITQEGFYELSNNCLLERPILEVSTNDSIIQIEKYLENTHFKKEYKYIDDFSNNETDLVKYREGDSSKEIKIIKLGQKKEVINKEGRFFDLYFGKKELILPFQIELDKIINTTKEGDLTFLDYKAQVKIHDGTSNVDNELIELNSPLYINGWNLHLDTVSTQENGPMLLTLNLLYDPNKWIKIAGFSVFCLGLLILAFQRKKKRKEH
ncbi:hypothetical protein [Halobacteriovorax sp.]|uniref:hypothetical protein n=1 Tax=Halobacteriovorax sp. TaxID=2020862 RepID=UPI003AF221E6